VDLSTKSQITEQRAATDAGGITQPVAESSASPLSPEIVRAVSERVLQLFRHDLAIGRERSGIGRATNSLSGLWHHKA
jgi:hypothetical protein